MILDSTILFLYVVLAWNVAWSSGLSRHMAGGDSKRGDRMEALASLLAVTGFLN